MLLLGTLFVVASNYFYIKMPIFLKDVIDTIIGGGSQIEVLGWSIPIDTSEALKVAFYIGAVYMVLVLLKSVFLFFMRQTIIKVSRYIEYDLKNEIYEQYQRLGYNFYKENSTGDLMNRISEDVSYVRTFLGPGIMYNINLLVVFTLIVYQMININVWLTVIVLIPLPIMSYLIYKVSNKINKVSLVVQKEQSGLSTIVQETFTGIRVIKAYERENEVNSRFVDSSKVYKKKQMSLVLINAFFQPTILLLIGLSTILAIYVGGLFTFTGEITYGGIAAFVFFVGSLTWPFASLGWLTSIIQRAAASQERINEFLKIQPEIVNVNHDAFEFKGRIEFRNVTYTYKGMLEPAINNLSFVIEPHETVAFVGRTASGKSTVLKLLLRQIEPQSGTILIDNQPLNELNLDNFREQIGIVPQEVFLFSDTILNNIRFGSTKEVMDEEVKQAAEYAHIKHTIESFEFGFDTVLGERGVNLSGGQKQRISIARALVRKPKLLLLDDCLSAVDTETEEIILRHFEKDVKVTNTIIVSHRISSLRNAHKIIVLNKGEKIEEGTPDELIALNGVYKDMYTKQLIEEND
ncbi:MAG: ABC transporter ATP-binding protein/permease [Crocinitomicaceae bacterium]|nr:ABC transporter ATP-binding protein/permease [Crocinitomicaceae bacterium]